MEIDIKIIVAVIALVSAIISTAITQIVLIRKFKKSIHENYRQVFFEKQLLAYQKFWTTLRPLSRLYNEETILLKSLDKNEIVWFLNEKPARNFCRDTTDFFFSEYGLFLGRTTRSHLFDLRNKIHYRVNAENVENGKIKLNAKTRKDLNKGISTLITSVRKDIGVLNLKFNFDELELDEKELKTLPNNV